MRFRQLNKKYSVLIGVLLIWLSPYHSVLATDLKIGVVIVAKVLEMAPQAEAASKKLEREFVQRDKNLAKAQQEFNKLKEQLERDGDIMSESERRKLERDVIARKRDLRRDKEEFREDVNMRRNEELGILQRRISEVILSLARDGGYDLILSDGVVFASDTVDITDQVIKRLKRPHKKPVKATKKSKK